MKKLAVFSFFLGVCNNNVYKKIIVWLWGRWLDKKRNVLNIFSKSIWNILETIYRLMVVIIKIRYFCTGMYVDLNAFYYVISNRVFFLTGLHNIYYMHIIWMLSFVQYLTYQGSAARTIASFTNSLNPECFWSILIL